MILIDGSVFEGGGQIVRTALALSTYSGKPVRITNIRAGRSKPGLKTQHVKCIEALTKLCNAKCDNPVIGASEITFVPGPIRASSIEVHMNTAGSITLLLQSILIPLLTAPRAMTITLHGGTNGVWAMPVEFVQHVLLPFIRPFYKRIDLKVLKRGYYPIGGGIIELKVSPRLDGDVPQPFNLAIRPPIQCIKGIVHASDALASKDVLSKMLAVISRELRSFKVPIDVSQEYADTKNVGFAASLWAICEDPEERLPDTKISGDALNQRKESPEVVSLRAVNHLKKHWGESGAVDHHVADNLIPFFALIGGRIHTSHVTPHLLANMYVCEKFLPVKFNVNEVGLIVADLI